MTWKLRAGSAISSFCLSRRSWARTAGGEMAADKLREVAELCPVSWSQRLGYLLGMVGQEDIAQALEPFVIKNARSYTPLRRAARIAGGKRNPRWKLIVNVDVEPDV